MEIKRLSYEFSVCKVEHLSGVDLSQEFCFGGKTDEETSLVCMTQVVPAETLAREDGWRAFKIQGVLDFALVGVLAKIATVLAENEISIFAISTFNTDYVLVRAENEEKAAQVLGQAGYCMV